MANIQALLPNDLTVQQVALILDFSVYFVKKQIELGEIESEDMFMIPKDSIVSFLMKDRSWDQESAERHIYNNINS
jgi:hypothetical protein